MRDEQSIQQILTHFEDAWNRSDSHGIAALFAEDANFIQVFGGQLDGRGAIEASHRHILDTIYKGSTARLNLRSVRFLHPDVAVVFAHAHITLKQAAEPREITTRPTFVVVKEQGTWKIVVFQNTKISEMPAAARPAADLAT